MKLLSWESCGMLQIWPLWLWVMTKVKVGASFGRKTSFLVRFCGVGGFNSGFGVLLKSKQCSLCTVTGQVLLDEGILICICWSLGDADSVYSVPSLRCNMQRRTADVPGCKTSHYSHHTLFSDMNSFTLSLLLKLSKF